MILDRPGNRFPSIPPGFAGIVFSLGLLLLHAPSTPAQPALAPPADSSLPAASAQGAADSAGAGGVREAVSLAVQGAFTAASPRVGDSLDYVLRVEWADVGVPVVVLAPDSLDFQGFRVIGQATVHKKLVLAQGVGNRTEFTYRLRAVTPGAGRASSLKVRYLSGVSRDEEAVFAPAAHIDILPGRTPLRDALWFRLLAGWLFLAAAVAAAWAVFRAARRMRKPKAGPAEPDLRPELLALKERIRKSALASTGDSKSIILQMEDLCIRHLRHELGGAPSAGEGKPPPPKFDPLLDQYLARNGNAASGAAADWNGLRELFRHARFAGGHKEPHELQDAYRGLKRALRITDEPGEE